MSLLIAAGFCCLLACGQARAQAPTQLPERDLAGGEIHTFKLTLSRGQFVRGVFEQRGISMAVVPLNNSGAPFAHPYFWAPFILIGNWR